MFLSYFPVILVTVYAVFFISSYSNAFFAPSSNRHRSVKFSPVNMNMFDRFVRVVSSNVNNVLSNLEEPEKVLDQAVTDMQKDLVFYFYFFKVNY